MRPSRELWIPQDVLGGAVPAELLVAHTHDVALVIRHLAAYPDSFSFALLVRLREPHPKIGELMEELWFNSRRRKADRLYLTVEFADGRAFGPPVEGRSADEPTLETFGGGGGSEGFTVELSVPALPTEGTVAFVCTWEAKEIIEARAELDARLIAEAAERFRPLWADP